jgi:hypothetical protein
VLVRPLEPKQYTSIRFAEHLALVAIRPSIGSVGDAYDTQGIIMIVDVGSPVEIARENWRTGKA